MNDQVFGQHCVYYVCLAGYITMFLCEGVFKIIEWAKKEQEMEKKVI